MSRFQRSVKLEGELLSVALVGFGGVVVETDGAVGRAGGEERTGGVPGDVPGAFVVS